MRVTTAAPRLGVAVGADERSTSTFRLRSIQVGQKMNLRTAFRHRRVREPARLVVAVLTASAVSSRVRRCATTRCRDSRDGAQRTNDTKAEVVAAAWALALELGVVGFTMRELGTRMGMTGPALYQYFPNKLAIVDALFVDGFTQLNDALDELNRVGDADESFRLGVRVFVDFCVEQPVRFQLLFQRPIPQFTPSDRSMAESIRTVGFMTDGLRRLGVASQAALDTWAASDATHHRCA